MTKAKVALVRCESYDEDVVSAALKKGIDLIGGIDLFVKENEKILLKVSNIAGAKPEEAVTTHPAVFNAIIKILLEKKVEITYGDSPGFEKSVVGMTKSGYTEIANRYHLKLGDFERGKPMNFPKGMVCKKFNIANACLQADGIISLPKMKTHRLTRITGAVKNQFGCVYGRNKAAFHIKFRNPTDFSKMLVDLNTLIKPRLFIMDGILAMEGNGPQGGDPIQMNCLLFSTDPIAIDSMFCRMIDLDPMFVATIKYGTMARLGTYRLEDLELVGEPHVNFKNKNFNVVRKPVRRNSLLKSFIPSALRNALYARPIIISEKCTRCGICVAVCPVEGKAVNFKDHEKKEPPVYDYSKCIRCYCCQEMCPFKAIVIEK